MKTLKEILDESPRVYISHDGKHRWAKDKIGSGYTNQDGSRQISKHPKGWIDRSTNDTHDYSDVWQTKREAMYGKTVHFIPKDWSLKKIKEENERETEARHEVSKPKISAKQTVINTILSNFQRFSNSTGESDIASLTLLTAALAVLSAGDSPVVIQAARRLTQMASKRAGTPR